MKINRYSLLIKTILIFVCLAPKLSAATKLSAPTKLVDITAVMKPMTDAVKTTKETIKLNKDKEDKRFDTEKNKEEAELKKAGVKADDAAMKQFGTLGTGIVFSDMN